MNRNEKEKMIAGEIYNALDPVLVQERYIANVICAEFNSKAVDERNLEHELSKLLKTNGQFMVKPPFQCDYGYNIHLEENVFINYNCVFLDVCPIEIGANTLIGPCTQIYTACHPVSPSERLNGVEFGKKVVIGKNVWIGGGCIILPGVCIGNHSVLGAGSVVTHDIPDYVVAAGNPCKVLKHLDKDESKE